MNTFTHQLPLVNTEPIETTETIAQNTNGSLLSGILNGALFEIEGFIEAARKQSKKLNVILSGGNTLYFVKKIKSQIFANSNITLTGLKEIIKLNEQTKNS
jgi:type III pantothenate kinase